MFVSCAILIKYNINTLYINLHECYIYLTGIDKYRYFMRVDDDVYVNGDKLDAFLNSLNYSQALYIGNCFSYTCHPSHVTTFTLLI